MPVMNVRLVYSGRGYDAAASLPGSLSLPDGSTLDDALRAIGKTAQGFTLQASCLVAVSGIHLGTVAAHRAVRLHDGDEILLIAPVAGG
jgi:hypothetical protein